MHTPAVHVRRKSATTNHVALHTPAVQSERPCLCCKTHASCVPDFRHKKSRSFAHASCVPHVSHYKRVPEACEESSARMPQAVGIDEAPESRKVQHFEEHGQVDEQHEHQHSAPACTASEVSLRSRCGESALFKQHGGWRNLCATTKTRHLNRLGRSSSRKATLDPSRPATPTHTGHVCKTLRDRCPDIQHGTQPLGSVRLHSTETASLAARTM